MPSIINSDDGVVSGTSGIKSTGGNDGILVFQSSGTETARITAAGNVGIGTNSPSQKLTVAGNQQIQGTNCFLYLDNGGVGGSAFKAEVIGSTSVAIGSDSNHPLLFKTNSAERMRITSAGNVGIGTTSPGAKLHVVGSGTYQTGIVSQESGQNFFTFFGFGADGIIGTAGAIRFASFDGTSERMRIDSSGNVGIGTSSPSGSYKVDISSGSNSGIRSYQSVTNYSYYALGNYTSGGSGGIYHAANVLGLRTDGAYALVFGTDNTERMRIDSSGDYLFLGGTLRVKNAANNTQYGAIYANSSEFHVNAGVDNLVFTTAGGECARFTAAREFLVRGTTDQGAYNIQCNGTGVWGAGAYVNGSDARIKNDIQSIASGLDVVEKLNPVTYRYKEEWSKDQSVQTGFIAQELLVALEGKNYVDGIVQQGGSNNYYSVAYQNIIPILTKAIQELKAELDAVKSELQILKGN